MSFITKHLPANTTLDLLLLNTNDLVFLISKNFKVTAISNSALNFYAFSRIEVLNSNFLNIFATTKFPPPLTQQQLITALEKKITTTTITHNSVATNNNSHVIKWLAQPVATRNKCRCNQSILLIGKNVSENKNNFQSYFTNIVDCIPGSLYCKNLEGRYLWCNQFMLDTLGFDSLNKIIGKTDFDLWPDNAHKMQQNDRYVIKHGKTIFLEEMFVHRNAKTLHFTGVKMPLRNDNNKIIGIIGNILDITQLKQIETELRTAKEKAEQANEANQEKNKFISNMEHDLRTPCIGILQTIHRLEHTKKVQSTVKKELTYIAQASNQLLELLDDILYLSRIKSGEIPILFKKFNIKKMIDNITAWEQPIAREKGIELITHCDNNIPKILISDKHRVQRILINLINNAVKFTEKGSVKSAIKLIKHIDNKHVLLQISVKDTGIGIPKNQQEIIYERFFRVTSLNHNKYKGSGLGLSIVKQFVDELGGEIEVKSQRNKGTEFICVIPLQLPLLHRISEQNKQELISVHNEVNYDQSMGNDDNTSIEVTAHAQTKQRNAASLFASSQHLKILVVEDNELIQHITKRLLHNFVNTLDIAATGKNAVILARKNNYDLIFVDIGLPDIDGYQITQRIRKFNRVIPIIALTAFSAEQVKSRSTACGINDFLSKPLNEEKIFYIFNKWIPSNDQLKQQSKSQCTLQGKQTTKQFKQQSKTHITTRAIHAAPTSAIAAVDTTTNIAIIDLAMGAQLVEGDQKKALKTIRMMLKNFTKQRSTLHNLYINKKWKELSQIIHHLRSGIAYCGTPSLHIASANLERYLTSKRRHKLKKTITRLYETFLDTIKNVHVTVKQLRRSTRS